MKMHEFFTARYNDGQTVYETSLDWIYSHQGERKVSISPTIWLWKSGDVYFVDYVGKNIGCTLKVFDHLQDAEEYKERVGQMEYSDFRAYLIHEKR